jgi:site-specific DNA-cytosine methylase
MRVLVACEFSGAVRRAFRAIGHDAWSCDLLPAEDAGEHIQGDALEALKLDWDMVIAFPPCTHLCSSGARWWPLKQSEQEAAIEFAAAFIDCREPVKRVAVENPVGILSSRVRKPDQIIQPWQFGHGEVKTTCLWLTNLPALVPTHRERPDLFSLPAPAGREQRIWKMPPSPNRGKERSRTYEGVANAMAAQWGAIPLQQSA